MRIVVCIKQVPDSTALQLDPETHTLRRGTAPAVTNPFDLPALEEALRLRETHGGRLTVLSMGPPRAVEVLREALSRGADEAVLLCDSAFAGSDTWATSLVLAAAIRKLGGADLVVCGRQASDGDTGQVGPGLATHLGMAQLTYVRRILALTSKTVEAERMLEEGVERLRADLPCLIAVGREIHTPRLPTLAGLIRSCKRSVTQWDAAALGILREQVGLKGSPTRVKQVFAPPARRGCRRLSGVDALAQWLRQRVAALADITATPRNDDAGEARPDEGVRRSSDRNARPAPADPNAPSVWVPVEFQQGAVCRVTLELLGAARDLARARRGRVAALLLAPKAAPEDLALLGRHGADEILLLEHPRLQPWADESLAGAIAEFAARHAPEIVLFGATVRGRAIASRVAVTLRTGLTADCTRLEIDPENGLLLQTRPAFGGHVMATIVTPECRPQMATVRPGVMSVPSPRSDRFCHVRRLPAPQRRHASGSERLAFRAAGGGVDLAESRVIVSGGRGIGGREGFDLLRELAQALGGEVGGSRAAVEAGWLPDPRQVGQTGRTVRPRLYLAFGISGQIQHLAGIADAETVVAVNRDPEAPIFNAAEVGLVADWRETAQRLLREFRPLHPARNANAAPNPPS